MLGSLFPSFRVCMKLFVCLPDYSCASLLACVFICLLVVVLVSTQIHACASFSFFDYNLYHVL